MSAFERTILVTGSTDGIGKQTVLDLSKNPKNFVIVHGRSKEHCESVVQEIVKRNSAAGIVKNVDYTIGDFADMTDIKKLSENIVARFSKLNNIICNAGVLMKNRELSKNGLEMTFQVNHLAHFYLVNSLLQLLKSNQPSRIVVVSSICHDWHKIDWHDLQAEKNYEKYQQYSISKLANHLFGFALARRLAGTGVTCNVMEPGVVETKLLRNGGYHGSPVEQASAPLVYLIEASDLATVGDKYFSHTKKITAPSDDSRDESDQEKLWKISEELCKKFGL